MRLIRWLIVLAMIGLGVFWYLTLPKSTDPVELAGLEGDPVAGEMVFNAAGCVSCHAAPDAEGEAKLELAGGRSFISDFGTFYAPNISQDPVAGIGNWETLDLVNALKHGVSPSGEHFYPAFPYTTYTHADLQDMVSLAAYMKTLPASETPSKPHDVGFPFNIRRTLGIWQLMFMTDSWVLQDAPTPEVERGRYLVEALGHCGECHTPRNLLGGLQMSKWLGGGPNPSGQGTIPNITPGGLDWSAADIQNYLTTGFTPDFDTVGGEMVDVVDNLSKLPEEDVAAIVAYLKAVPAVEPSGN